MTTAPRTLPDRLQSPLASTLKSWESLLLAVAIAIFKHLADDCAEIKNRIPFHFDAGAV